MTQADPSHGSPPPSPDKLRIAAAFFRRSFWWSLIWMLGFVFIVTVLVVDVLNDGPIPAGRATLSWSDLLAYLGMLNILVMVVVFGIEYFRMKRVITLLDDKEWGDAAKRGLQALGWSCLFMVSWCLWPLGLACILIWLGRLGQLCGIVGDLFASDALRQKSRTIARNWKLLLIAAALLIILGVIMYREPERFGFFVAFLAMFLLFVMYSFVELLVALRKAARVLDAEAAKTGGEAMS